MPVPALTPASLAFARRQAHTLVDVRTAGELAIVALPDTLHIPLDELGERYQEIPADRPVLVICHHGVRSLHAAAFLQSRGYVAFNIAGGIDAVAAQVDPGLPRY